MQDKTPTIDDFDDKYTGDTSIKSEFMDPECQTGMLETFGSDLEQVLEINKKSPMKVWTAIDGDDGEVYLTQGFHWVNRVYYLITNESAENVDEYYQITGV